MCWCFIHYWIEKCTVKQWKSVCGLLSGSICPVSSRTCIDQVAKFICVLGPELHSTDTAVKKDIFFWRQWCNVRLDLTNLTREGCHNIMHFLGEGLYRMSLKSVHSSAGIVLRSDGSKEVSHTRIFSWHMSPLSHALGSHFQYLLLEQVQ